jgi:ParB-like chromosome segregation protein Spo0J|tara:strand:+ start:714 stop:1211 length:498 start_codon:yes stop_codon:yes gene_type:complete
MNHPIDSIQWIDAELLTANDYNPNVVLRHEFKLLEHSILKNGWIQPILVTEEFVIIDGFHRATLAKTSKKIKAMSNGKVPCTVLALSEPERMLLTVRINRAKGVHASVKMAELIKIVVEEYDYTIDQVKEAIGATKDEIELLLQENVFKALNIESHKYSEAWYPK